MATTTLLAFIDDLEALSVTGVVRRYTSGPPNSLNTGDLPAMWVQPPLSRTEHSQTFLGSVGAGPGMHASLAVALNPVAQNMSGFNFDNTVTMIDNLATALQIKNAVLSQCRMNWKIEMRILPVGEFAYWGVVAEIEGLN